MLARRIFFFVTISLVYTIASTEGGVLNSGVLRRTTDRLEIPSSSIGTRHSLLVHSYGPSTSREATKKCYVQATLHADEIPGLLVANHLIKLLDGAAERGEILEKVVIVPYANPIGLSQHPMGTHIGRFSLETGINFNRQFADVSSYAISRVEGRLKHDDEAYNVKIIRDAIKAATEELEVYREEASMKKYLYSLACDADVALDLHCDQDAVLHMYTHDHLWPSLSDLAAELGTECQLLAPEAGGNPFDEALSCPWANIKEKFPSYPIPMACHAVTVELRGESDVYDEYASKDARAIFRFLQRRGYIGGEPDIPRPELRRVGTPLTGVDMIEATKAGVVAWKKRPGTWVKAGDLLGEIVDIEDPDAPRTPVAARNNGLLFCLARHKLVRPGQVICKVSGETPLRWRTGDLLTSK